jgi:hypothetical protein
MNFQFIQTCVSGRTPLLEHYEEAKTRLAGKQIKKALLDTGDWTNFDLFIDYHVKVETMNYQKEKYVIVTHSQINHIYKLYN